MSQQENPYKSKPPAFTPDQHQENHWSPYEHQNKEDPSSKSLDKKRKEKVTNDG